MRSSCGTVPAARGRSGLTLVEVLMSLMVTGIGILGVDRAFAIGLCARAVQATNLTNGTILRYDAESMIDINPRLLLRWQGPQQACTERDAKLHGFGGSANGDLIVNPEFHEHRLPVHDVGDIGRHCHHQIQAPCHPRGTRPSAEQRTMERWSGRRWQFPEHPPDGADRISTSAIRDRSARTVLMVGSPLQTELG